MRYFYLMLCFSALLFTTNACFSDDDDNTTPNCVISAIEVADIVSDVPAKTLAGKDTIISKTISGSGIHFNIDQENGLIASVDSLPYWADITAVKPSLTYTGVLLYRQGGETEQYAYFSNGSTAIDFTKEVEFLVVATDGENSRHYNAKLYKSKVDGDSLYWNRVESNLSLKGNHRSIVKGDLIYVFADNGGNTTITSSDASGKTLNWTSPQTLSENVNYQSVTLYNDLFYALNTEGKVYASANGIDWTKQADIILQSLYGSDSQQLYGYDGTTLLASADGVNWQEEPGKDFDYLPQMPVSTVCYPTKTNASLENVVMMGLNPKTENAVVWFKISSSNIEANQVWNYIDLSSDKASNNDYPMPALENLQMVKYNGQLFAIGGQSTDKLITPYKYIYVSADNGITWHVPTKNIGMAKDVEGSTQPVSMVVCGKRIWLIQSGGKTWMGEITNLTK